MKALLWIFVVAGLGCALIGCYPHLACLQTAQSTITRDADNIVDPQLLSISLDPDADWDERIRAVTPYCDTAEPLSGGIAWYLIGVLLMIASILVRLRSKPDLSKAELDVAMERVEMRTKRANRPASATHTLPIDIEPLQIDLDDTKPRDSDTSSLMAIVERKRTDSEATLDETSRPDLKDRFVPTGMETKPFLFVDPHSSNATDEDTELKLDNTSEPFRSLQAALRYARQLVPKYDGIQVRIAPGVYSGPIEIPDRVALVNHRMVAGLSGVERVRQLLAQDIKNPMRVTILSNPNSPTTLTFEPGQKQGLFGIHVIGSGESQTGVTAYRNRFLRLYGCAIESFTNHGLSADKVGNELPNQGLNIGACVFRENTGTQGGAITTNESAIQIKQSFFFGNRARRGGAIFVAQAKHPVLVHKTRFENNRAQLPDNPETDPTTKPLHSWLGQLGVGGAVCIAGSRSKFVGCEFVDNGASVAGGGLAIIASKAVVQSTDGVASRFSRNRSRIGGGMVVVGWPNFEATCKLESSELSENIANAFGGGATAIGHATLQAIDTNVIENEATGDAAIGGGISCHLGGAFVGHRSSISHNRSNGHGGGIATVNGRLNLSKDCIVERNRAEHSGGGIFAITKQCPITESLVENQTFEIPLVVTLEESTIAYNVAEQDGGGLRAGNLSDRPTLPLGIKCARGVIRSNQSSRKTTTNVLVTWAGKNVSNVPTELTKLLLK